MKSIIAAGLLLGCAHGAVAAPYANVESNTSWYGNDYLGSVIEAHGGYEGALGKTVPGLSRLVPPWSLPMVVTRKSNCPVRSVLATKSLKTWKSMVSTASSPVLNSVVVLRLA